MKAKTEESISTNRIFSEKEMVPNCKTFVLSVFFHYNAIVVILLKVAFFSGPFIFLWIFRFLFPDGRGTINVSKLHNAAINYNLEKKNM